MPIMIASKLPYTLHTNRELGLMLKGIKPLAVFADGKEAFPESVARYLRLFERHVATGSIVRVDHFSEPTKEQSFTLHTILFALPNEVWRIEAMLDLRASGQWGSPEAERREGELLGYEHWMNDHFMQMFYP